MAFEYNPFFNYQTNENLVEYNGFLIPENKAVDKRNGRILICENGKWKDQDKNIIDLEYVLSYSNAINDSGQIITKDSLINLDTQQLNFDINHPLDIEIQPSYDGSVNLIINDDKNTPRLINSRFSTREKNTYEIVDRIGENDTNIYSSDSFEKDTSLYFQYKTNPKIYYKGFINGILPVGQYCFYFTYCDADNNESDFIGESGLIPVFIGVDGDPFSMDGGIKNQVSNKGIKLQLKNLDSSYNYLKIYYIRYFADYQQNRVYDCKKIYQKYAINSNRITIQITGNEEAEDLDPNILNAERFNAKSILTQAQCKNMLFFGNIVKNYDNYKELQDCALRIVPKCLLVDNANVKQNKNYSKDGYYSSYNMYSNVGYFNGEYYRFGVVFIYDNGTLSSVYNTLGYDTNNQDSINYIGNLFDQQNGLRKYIKIDDEGWVINQGDYSGNYQLNSRGVCKIINNSNNSIIKVQFKIPEEISNYLTTLGIRGLFFVRQKRIPNLLAQCYILPMDTVLQAPVIKVGEGEDYRTESFVTQEKSYIQETQITPSWTYKKKIVTQEKLLVENAYDKRIYKYGSPENISFNSYAAICPDFLLNQPYYNQIFNGSKFKLQRATSGAYLEHKESSIGDRFYIEKDQNINFKDSTNKQVKICTVTEDVPTIALDKTIFKLEIGKGEESYRFNYAQIDNGTYSAGDEDFDSINNATNIVRGKYSPYLAISGSTLDIGELYNIYQDSYIDDDQQYLTRMHSSEPFYAISDRYNWEEFNRESTTLYLDCFRGDCYYNIFTYRLNRNFNDASLPNNDQIIDKNTWKDHYRAQDPAEFKNISRSDINAVQLGSWITIEVMSSYNYALRSEDNSYVSEAALMGSPRSFYPRKQSMWLGNYKMPDSYLYNDAYRASLGYKRYFSLQDTNYVKNSFSNRIQYSAIAIQDSFKNNYRESYSTYFRDYSSEYGSIQKLVEINGNLLVVFEHAIGLAAINERILAGEGDGGEVFINTKNVLPEELVIITNTYGTQWPESVIKTEAGNIYGVDTIAKKIWRIKGGQQLELISDFKVNKFLIDNISLGERELYPIIGIKNVKTHYNNNKKDIMFTFYDDIYKDEEKVWNLCYNELLEEFITFYSWVPSYSENIDTQFFSFNRNTSKAISMLDVNNYANASRTGVVLNSPLLTEIKSNGEVVVCTTEIYYRDPATKEIINDSAIEYKILKDHWGYYSFFTIDRDEPGKKKLKITGEGKNNLLTLMKSYNQKVVTLYIQPIVYNGNIQNGEESIMQFKPQQICFTFKELLNSLTTDFYLHGRAGIFNVTENIYPTHWYGEYHPFEFEFVVNDKIGQQKIFTNLEIISNKAEPESFHFEIEGDNYEFSSDKRNMYFRQEATKNIYQNLGSDMLYDRSYTDVAADPYTYEQYYRGGEDKNSNRKYNEYKDYYNNKMGFDKVYPVESQGLVKQEKSTIFPLYYEKVDTYNDIYYMYRGMLDEISSQGYDFKNLSGSEINWNRDLNQFNIITHIKNNQIPLVGNSYYKEGKWHIQIPSIVFNQKNETSWGHISDYFTLDQSQLDGTDILLSYPGNISNLDIPPIVINSTNIPKDLQNDQITYDKLPNIYKALGKNSWEYGIDVTNGWTYRKETKIRDKWMKVRVRYSGKNLAIIHSVITLYNISYS